MFFCGLIILLLLKNIVFLGGKKIKDAESDPFDEIKAHGFFKGIDWKTVMQTEAPKRYIENVLKAEDDEDDDLTPSSKISSSNGLQR